MAPKYQQFIRSLTDDTPLAVEDALAMMAEAPFFTLPASRALLNDDIPDDVRSRLLASVALNAPDTTTLVTLIDPEGSKFASFYPETDRIETPSTDNAIDTFLQTYGNGIDPKEEALLEKLIFNPAPDYSEVLAREAAESPAPATQKSEQDRLLDQFLSSHAAETPEPAPQPAEHPTVPERHTKPDADSPLSESLAKIFIRRGRYDKAFEIIKQLSLNFPEKSVYFADQLRFLQKLIYNQSFAKNGK